MNNLISQLQQYIQSGYFAFYLQSAETERVDNLLKQVAEQLQFRVVEYNLAYGKVDFANKSVSDSNKQGFEKIFADLNDEDLEQHIILIKNAKLGLENHPLAISRLQFLLEKIQRHHKGECAVILQSAEVVLPADIEPMVTLLELPLPQTAEIKPLVQQHLGDIDNALANRIATALSGLNELELVQLLNLLKNRFGQISEAESAAIFNEIQHQKEQIIAKSGVLEMVKVDNQLSDIGGLENLKTWLSQQSEIFNRLEEAKAFGVKAPKGTLIAGMPGCGKSLTAKAAAHLFQQPLLRLDIGSLLGKYVGESETNMRKALAMAESISPCVLWVDELEKAFVGMSGNNASEVSSRLLGYFLTWLQEKTAPVFIVATANDITALPPELLRKGRFDEIFYVAFPNKAERHKILEIHLAKAKQSCEGLDLNELAIQCRDYAGADIENAVYEAVKHAFLANSKLTQHLLAESIEKTIPLRKTLKDKVGEYEKKFDELFLTSASSEDGFSIAQMLNMSKDTNYLKRKEVAEYDEVTEDILEKLTQDEKIDIRRAAFKNPNCPAKLLDKQLTLDEDDEGYDEMLLEVISKHRNTSFELAFEEFDFDSEYMLNLFSQPQHQHKLFEYDQDFEITKKLINKNLLVDELYAQLAEIEDVDLILTILEMEKATEPFQVALLQNPIFSNRNVKEGLARNPNLIEAAKQKLVLELDDINLIFTLLSMNKKNEFLQMKLLQNPILSNSEMKIRLADHFPLIEDIQQSLASDSDYKVINGLASNPSLTRKLQAKLVNSSNNETRKILASNISLVKHIQIKLSSDLTYEVRESLASNASLINSLQLKLLSDSSPYVIKSLASNPSLIRDVQVKLVSLKEWYFDDVLINLASNPSLVEDLQVKFSSSRRLCAKKLKLGLARNLSLIEKVQAKLALTSDYDVRVGLAANPSLVEKLQVKLVSDSNWQVRAGLARNLSLVEKLQVKLASDSNWQVRAGLARNPSLIEKLQVKLASDSDTDVRKSLVNNPSLNAKIKEKLLNASPSNVITGVAVGGLFS